MSRSACSLASNHIYEYAHSRAWQEQLSAFTLEKAAEHAERLGITQEDLMGMLEEDGRGNAVFGIFFEHFLQQTLEDAPHNVIEDFLKRRGWRESQPGKKYLSLLKEAPLSVFEVVDVEPGQWAIVQDLIRPLPAVKVIEKSGTQHLKIFDRLIVRVIPVISEYYFSGSVSRVDSKASDKLVAAVREVLSSSTKDVLENLPPEQAFCDATLPTNQTLRSFDTEFITASLEYLVADHTPVLLNAHGEDLVLTEIRWPIQNWENTRKALSSIPDFVMTASPVEGDDHFQWDWVMPKEAVPSHEEKEGLRIETSFYSEDEELSGHVYANLTLKDRVLEGSVNSKERTERLLAIVTPALGDAVGEPKITYQSASEFIQGAGKPARPSRSPQAKGKDDIPPEIQRQLSDQMLTEHYLALLDKPLPLLGGKTPYESVQTPEGRQRVLMWLKSIEQNHRSPEMAYDSSWLWEELGVADLRGKSLVHTGSTEH